MRQYLQLMKSIMDRGVSRMDRTGTGTMSLFGPQLVFDLANGFPLMTTKRIHFKSVAHELLWMLRGETNIKSLNAVGVTIWDEWADENGELGPVYGKQWRSWIGVSDKYANGLRVVDQITDVVHSIKTNPYSRRHIVSAWNPVEVDDMKLPPCHCMFQFYVADGRLSCHMYLRSADIFLGVPFNVASYALLTQMIAHVTGYRVGRLIVSYGDVHLYSNHVEQAQLQLSRTPGKLPTVVLNDAVTNINFFTYDDIKLIGYEPQAAIQAKVAV